ncbi:Cupin domain-containing protein [Pseudoduganella lurida]|uniref:Cupin domain-containing protein n=1 Tax=Pseudoduganella lurida TaxID=1036180 RepID=A0A562RE55_9BURK|nr:cupin domain-containing protein [Pseudoduganella lurida]TWI67367.1 Cupin domain-containing protein [Pseudoduganella lurida]
MSLNPQQTYVHLADSGAARELPGGDAFWRLPEAEMDSCGSGWLVTEFAFTADWPNWEMHPHADEFVYLLSGAMELHLEEATGLRKVALEGSGAVVVPRGVWHTGKVLAPSRMLHVTRGEGTQQRPA